LIAAVLIAAVLMLPLGCYRFGADISVRVAKAASPAPNFVRSEN